MTMSPGSRPMGTPTLMRRPATTRSRPTMMRMRPIVPSHFELHSSKELHATEKIAELEGRGVRRIRAVSRVVLDRGAELLPQRPGVRLRRIGRSHEVAPFLDRAIRLERHDDARPRGHEVRQTREEWPLAMYGVKAFRFG